METHTTFQQRLIEHCVSMYTRHQSLSRIFPFLERLAERQPDIIGNPHVYYEEIIIPAMREHYYPGVSTDMMADRCLDIYRNHEDRSLGLALMWEHIHQTYPLTGDDYLALVDRIDALLEQEVHPPTQQDWQELDEFLSK